ncbi:MAG: hypothetical protein WED01_14095 [Candidatus Rokuibacteriota bacterium]
MELLIALDLYSELRAVAGALEGGSIPYALAGGLAVSIYTVPRATEDIDLVLDPADVERAIPLLTPLGFRRAGAVMRVAGGRLGIQRLTKIEGADALPLDLLLPADPVLLTILNERSAITVEGWPLWIVSVRGLRALKELRGSARDRADLEALGPDTP